MTMTTMSLDEVRSRVDNAIDVTQALDLLDDARNERHDAMGDIVRAAEVAARDLLADEQRRFDRLLAEVRELDKIHLAHAARARREFDRDVRQPLVEAEQARQQTWRTFGPRSAAAGRASSLLLPDDGWLAPTPSALATMHRLSMNGGAELVEHRATVASSTIGANELAGELPLSIREPRRLAAVAGIPVYDVQGIEISKYPVFGDADEAGIQTEGNTKAEYDDITEGTATPQVIALWTDTTRQAITTMDSFAAKLVNTHMSRVARREDKLLVDTVLANSSITTSSGVVGPDTILEAAALVADSDVGTVPNVFVLNPLNVTAVFGADVGTGGSASPNFRDLDLQLHGMRCYISGTVGTYEAIVASWDAGSRFIYGWRPRTFVDAVSQMKSNLITYLTEEAVALAIDEPTAFCNVTLTT
jgi:hypothetical protein